MSFFNHLLRGFLCLSVSAGYLRRAKNPIIRPWNSNL